MSGPASQYAYELYTKFGYRATWLPGTPLKLGDVGVINDHVFTRLAGLNDLGIQWKERSDPSAEDLFYQSTSGITMAFKLAGEPVPAGSGLLEAKAGVSITFERQAAVIFAAKGCRVPSIENQIAVGEEIKKLYKAGKWDRQYYVVTEVVNAETFTALVSESGGGKLELIAEGALPQGAVGLADLKANFHVARSQSMHTQTIAQEALTPLFRVRRLARPWYVLPLRFQASGVDPLALTPAAQIDLNELSFDLDVPTFPPFGAVPPPPPPPPPKKK